MSDHETVRVFGAEVTLRKNFNSAAGDLPDVGESYRAQHPDGADIGELKSVLAWRWRRTLPDGTIDEGIAATRESALALMMESASRAERNAAAPSG